MRLVLGPKRGPRIRRGWLSQETGSWPEPEGPSREVAAALGGQPTLSAARVSVFQLESNRFSASDCPLLNSRSHLRERY
jgi:hypothetical protein